MLDELLTPDARPRRTRCAVCVAVEVEGEKLTAALDDPRVMGSNIARWLQGNGYHILATTVRRHRNGECRGA